MGISSTGVKKSTFILFFHLSIYVSRRQELACVEITASRLTDVRDMTS